MITMTNKNPIYEKILDTKLVYDHDNPTFTIRTSIHYILEHLIIEGEGSMSGKYLVAEPQFDFDIIKAMIDNNILKGTIQGSEYERYDHPEYDRDEFKKELDKLLKYIVGM